MVNEDDPAPDQAPRHYLRYWRDKRRLNQDALADLVGVTKFTVSRWEKFKQRITDKNAENLAETLSISKQELLFGPQAAPSIDPADDMETDCQPCDRATAARLGLQIDADQRCMIVTSHTVSLSRAGLRPGDIAVFDTSDQALEALRDGRVSDGAVVLATVSDGAAVWIIRQWLGPAPGTLVANRVRSPACTPLAARGDITVAGVLLRAIREVGPAKPQ